MYFFRNSYHASKTRNYQTKNKIFPLNPDDVIVMSSNVHGWIGKVSQGPLFDISV